MRPATRRDFLALSSAAPLLLLPRPSGAQTSPLSPDAMNWIVSMSRELYTQAFLRDESNGFTGVGISPSTLRGFLSGWQSLDSAMASSGVYTAPLVSGGFLPADRISPTYAKFVANQAQLSLPENFFSMVSLADVAADMEIAFSDPLRSGADVRTLVSGVLASVADYASGNLAFSQRRGQAKLVLAMYQTAGAPYAREQTLATASGIAMASGLGMLQAAGGVGVLTGSTAWAVAPTLGVALASTGVGLFVLGAATLVYVVYRVYTQKTGESPTPWQKQKDMPSSSPNYQLILERSQGLTFPPLFPSEPVPAKEI